MANAILGIIGSLLLIVIGLWKFFANKGRIIQKRKDDAANEIKQGIKDKDPSTITGGFDSMPH